MVRSFCVPLAFAAAFVATSASAQPYGYYYDDEPLYERHGPRGYGYGQGYYGPGYGGSEVVIRRRNRGAYVEQYGHGRDVYAQPYGGQAGTYQRGKVYPPGYGPSGPEHFTNR